MRLDLSDEETTALLKELDDIIQSDRFFPLAAHTDVEGDPRQETARAGPPTFAATEGVCATASDGRHRAGR